MLKNYRITLDNRHNGILRATSPANALCRFLKLLSATHVLPRGVYAAARRHNIDPDRFATVHLWQSTYQRAVYATATLLD
jgi:hypothetical protein